MASPPPPSSSSSSLPVGWSEHVSPQGQPYWYNQATGQSTYTHPSSIPPPPPPGFSVADSSPAPVYTGPPPIHQNTVHATASSSSSVQNGGGGSGDADADKSKREKKAKKEKPAKKESIPGAPGWLRVTTTLGNIFYTHVESKRSEWTIPDEIKEHVEAMQDEERRIRVLEEEERRLAKEQKEEEERLIREQERLERQKAEQEEYERRQAELRRREEAVRKQREERERIQRERMRILEEQGKRKREEEEEQQRMSSSSIISEENGDHAKRLRTENHEQGEGHLEWRAEGENADGDDGLAWQREMAAEMAAEAEANEARSTTPDILQPTAPAATVSADAEISSEEAKALFMHMLTGLNGTSNEINPMAPWDRELPKFIHERDYTVLKTLRDRQDAFNDWCKFRLKEKRNSKTSALSKSAPDAKAASAATAAPAKTVESNGSSHSERLGQDSAADQYRALLEGEVKSTRMKWDDFKKTFRKDRRFFSFGRDDRERERAFRDWLKQLGEKKRRAAEEADNAFIVLLEEHLGQAHRMARDASTEEVQSAWAKAKRTPNLDRDVRYDAVGSSSRRAELFSEWARGVRRAREGAANAEVAEEHHRQPVPKEGPNRALKEREEAVLRERRDMEAKKQRAFGQAVREESLTSFRQLLIDAVRDPLSSVHEAMQSISHDGRFDAPGLWPAEKERLAHDHIEDINIKRLHSLEEVFAKHAPTLDVEAEVALPLIKDDDEIQRKHLDGLKVLKSGRRTIHDLFDDWNRSREERASGEFQQMLKENAFVNFWGRLRQEHEQREKDGATGASGKRQGEDEEDDDEPDLLQMAGNVDLEEIHSILRNDQRYRAFRHKPEKRDDWIRHHLQTMPVPKKTVYQQD